jgi:hypothetical protein
MIARNGTERPIDDSAAAIRGDDGGIAGVVLAFRDIRKPTRSAPGWRRRRVVG